MVAEKAFVIINRQGLHARAANRFALTASRFSAEIEVERDGRRANGKSIIGVLVLVAAQGDVITIRGKGCDAAEALQALGAVISSSFGETEESAAGDGARSAATS